MCQEVQVGLERKASHAECEVEAARCVSVVRSHCSILLPVSISLVVCVASRSLLEGNEFFQVPEVIDELSGRRVLAMELVQGVPLDQCVDLDQETRNQV